MHAVKVIPMSHEESQDRERVYKDSQNPIEDIRKKVDRIAHAMGEIKTAISGDDMGNDGLAKKLSAMQTEIIDVKARLYKVESIQFEIETTQRVKNRLWGAVYGLLGVVLGSTIATIINRIFKK
jgi:peptidoglycan hydrolase CwlO-like protein